MGWLAIRLGAVVRFARLRRLNVCAVLPWLNNDAGVILSERARVGGSVEPNLKPVKLVYINGGRSLRSVSLLIAR